MGGFKTIERLGGGGFDDVYRAEDSWRKMEVALKIPRDQTIPFEKFLKEPRLFSRERFT